MPPLSHHLNQIKASIRAMGRNVDWKTIAKTHLLYSRLLDEAPQDNVKVTDDAPYGPHGRHRVDIYAPAHPADHPLPILVFVHGGGFIQGDECRTPNIGYYFARHGMVTILANYRLAPEHQWPSGAQDMEALVQWIGRNGAFHGGDVDTIFCMGHSAGAAHVSDYLLHRDFRQGRGPCLAGAILLSGPAYDTGRLNPQKDFVYYGRDTTRHAAMSVITHIEGPCLPVLIVYAEWDPPSVEYQSVALYNALRKQQAPRLTIKRLMDHNHISEIMHIGTDDESLGPDILDFVKAVAADRLSHIPSGRPIPPRRWPC